MSEISKLEGSELESITFSIETLKKLRDIFKISCQHFKEISMVEFPENGSFLSKVMILFMKHLNTISTELQTITQVFEESKINIKDNISLFEKLKSDIKQTYTSFDDEFLIHKKEFKNIVEKQRNISNELIRLQIETLNNQNILEYQQLVSEQKNLKGQSIQIQETLNQHQINLEREVQSFGDEIEKNINGSQKKAIELISFSLNEYIRVYENIFKLMNNEFVINPEEEESNQKAIVQEQIIDEDDGIRKGELTNKERYSKSQYTLENPKLKNLKKIDENTTDSSNSFFVESHNISVETLENNINLKTTKHKTINNKSNSQIGTFFRNNEEEKNGFCSNREVFEEQKRNYSNEYY